MSLKVDRLIELTRGDKQVGMSSEIRESSLLHFVFLVHLFSYSHPSQLVNFINFLTFKLP